ncbi:uncharacterized protein PGRI_090200 [Penicillium griseofulvum]|uniref:Uncharacterized protein n=1 Tax=Penicillium patulum TaxID=5078 RepID=A0A135LRM2_PENPA|nr:uncharacterized protein PGRI_090200 [Penicillium griseofulvum]KXG51627.1 hypothetical protein PGRI_090200 [Penicillium griseofulvum]
MAYTNFIQDLSTYLDWILLLVCFGFVLCFGSITFVIVHCIVQILQAAAAFYLFDILYYFIYEEESIEYFVDLISNILTSRLELKSFILLLCILFAIHHSIQEIVSVLREKFLAPNTTIIVDCPKQPMQSPQIAELSEFSKIADEMARIHPKKWAKPVKSTTPNPPKDSQPKNIKPKDTKPTVPEPTIPEPSKFQPTPSGEPSFAAHGNRYMRHPWGVIDYHIYLTHIESRRDKLHREKECYLPGTTGFTQVSLHDETVLEDVFTHSHPTVVFASLPVPDVDDESSIASMVLGFDLESRRLQGYYFQPESPIKNYEDLWKVWSQGEGQLVIDIPVDRFLAVIRHTMQQHIEILEIGLLRHYGLTMREFQAGLDMVITVQFLQFLDDFAELVSEDPEEIREIYTPFQDELRELLATGSRDSWFAVRDGLSIEQYRQKQLKKVVASGLFHGQKMLVLRDDTESTETNKVSRQVKVIPSHPSLWSWSKLRIRLLVSAMLILCFCSVFDREKVLCVGMF